MKKDLTETSDWSNEWAKLQHIEETYQRHPKHKK